MLCYLTVSVSQSLPVGSDEFKTKEGKTFNSVALDLEAVAHTIGEEGKAKLENANKNVVAAQAALDMAQAEYAKSKAEVKLLHFSIKI